LRPFSGAPLGSAVSSDSKAAVLYHVFLYHVCVYTHIWSVRFRRTGTHDTCNSYEERMFFWRDRLA